MSDKKKYIVHVSASGYPLFSEAINSRTELARYLRSQGLHFRDSELSDIGSDSVVMHSRIGIKYEIEEQLETTRSLIVDNREYVPLSDYCKETGESARSVQYAYKKNKIRGLTVGKKNYIYIYRRDIR